MRTSDITKGTAGAAFNARAPRAVVVQPSTPSDPSEREIIASLNEAVGAATQQDMAVLRKRAKEVPHVAKYFEDRNISLVQTPATPKAAVAQPG